MKSQFILSICFTCFVFFLIEVQTVKCQSIKLPDTPQGKIVTEYVIAFNSGNDETMKEFYISHLSKESLKKLPVENRLQRMNMIRKDLKSIQITKIIKAGETNIDVLVKSGNNELLTFMFEFEVKPAVKMLGLRIEAGAGESEEASGPPLKRDELIAEIDKVLTDLSQKDLFSGSVLVAKDTTVWFKNAYGYADKRFKTPNLTDTKYNLGSINKFFTRIAITQLVEKNKLSFDDLIVKHLPDYPNKTVAGKVKIQHLLDMSSGLGDFFGELYEKTPKDQIRTLKDYLQFFVEKDLSFEPGTGQQYSNAGYIVLGLIIEKISGQDYYAYVRENIFKPAGMMNTDSYFMDAVTPNLATGYTHPENDNKTWISNIYTAPGRGSSAGGGYSTVDDMFNLIQALRYAKILSPRYSSLILNRTLPEKDPALPIREGGFGIAGGAPGINSFADYNASTGETIIVFGNYDPPAAMDAAKKIRSLMKRIVK
jgi:D-alanyl-D-alanine carboxypeptidase